MADPRTTGPIDNFGRPDEDPLSGGGIWFQAFSDRDPMENKDFNSAVRRELHSTVRAYSYYTPRSWDGDVEVWGQRNESGLLIGHQEILGFVVGADGGLSVGQWDGYSVWIGQLATQVRFYLYRVDNGSNTELASEYADDNWVMLRRVGDDLEVWSAPTGVDDWTLLLSATDNTYMTDFWILIGEGDNNNSSHAQEGWTLVGGGFNENRPQFYRWIKN